MEEDNNNATIKVFDRSGSYLNNIGRIGRAANECLSLDYWTLDRVNNELIVAQGNGYGASVTIKRYDYKMNHLRDFWTVVREEKVRGTRMEFIAPENPHAIYICLGRDRKIYIVDPIAELYGPLSEVGVRCDKCSSEEAEHCVKSLIEKRIVPAELSQSERETLSLNKRSGFRPLDRALQIFSSATWTA